MPSKDFQNFTKKLNETEKEVIYEKWQKEHHRYLKAKYNFKKAKS